MDISMDIHEKSVDMDMDMDVIFHIHGNPAYNLYNNKPQAATEFSAKLDVCRIQYCYFPFASFERWLWSLLSLIIIIIIIIVRYQQVIDM